MRHTKYTKAAVTLALLALATPAAASAKTVTVRVEGTAGTLLSQTSVTIGSGSGVATQYGTSTPLPISCADDTAANALEQATHGSWDRSMYIQTILGETHGYDPDSWTIYDQDQSTGNPHYSDWGACDLHLFDGEKLVFQASDNASVANWRPYSPVLDAPVPSATTVTHGTNFTVSLKKWVVPNTADTVDPAVSGHWLSPAMTQSNAASYKITATRVGGGTANQTTNASGVATFNLATTGDYTFKADATTTGISGNYARSVPSVTVHIS